MHGLWPSRTGTAAKTYPCDCDHRGFNKSQLSSIADAMQQFWPSENADAEDFWAHEWTKHGTCSKDVELLQTELGFFNTTLGLRQARDIGAALEKSSIVPDSSRGYDKSALEAALTPITGFMPILECLTVGGKQYLHQASFCLDKTLQDIQCDDSIAQQGCSGSSEIIIVQPSTQSIALVV